MKYKIKKNQIKAILGYQIDLAQMKLEDGITIVEAEKFEPEYSVGIVTAEGVIPMPVGEYKLEDGNILVVEVEGIIASVSPEAEEEAMPEADHPAAEATEPQMEAAPSAPAPQAKRIVESVSKETFFAEIEKIRQMTANREAAIQAAIQGKPFDLAAADAGHGFGRAVSIDCKDELVAVDGGFGHADGPGGRVLHQDALVQGVAHADQHRSVRLEAGFHRDQA